MKAYRITHGGQIDGLQLEDIVDRPLEPYEVRVRVRAVSLNYRDLMVAKGMYPTKVDRPVIPCSDGAGDVIAIGSMVRRVKPGDRVAASFFPHWLESGPDQGKFRSALGGDVDGMLEQADAIRGLGVPHVLLKGGHASGDVASAIASGSSCTCPTTNSRTG